MHFNNYFVEHTYIHVFLHIRGDMRWRGGGGGHHVDVE